MTIGETHDHDREEEHLRIEKETLATRAAKLEELLDWSLDALAKAADALVAADFGKTAEGVRTIVQRITRERPRARTAPRRTA